MSRSNAHLSGGHGIEICQKRGWMLQIRQKLCQGCKRSSKRCASVSAIKATSQGRQISCKPPQLLFLHDACSAMADMSQLNCILVYADAAIQT